jgi:hypothetical protein
MAAMIGTRVGKGLSRLQQCGHAAERANVVPQVCDEWLSLAGLGNHVTATPTRQNHLALRFAECKHRPTILFLPGHRRTGLRKRGREAQGRHANKKTRANTGRCDQAHLRLTWTASA